MTQAVRINTNNTVERCEVNDLADMQQIVGGWLEAVRVRDGLGMMYLNEEGKLEGLAWNMIATAIADIDPHDMIVGDVFVVGLPDDGGDDTDVHPDVARMLCELPRTHFNKGDEAL